MNINLFETEFGIAFHAGESAMAAVITQNGGLVYLGEGITTAKYVKTDGDCYSYETSQELNARFVQRDFDILLDHSLPDDVVFVSSDLHVKLDRFLSLMDPAEVPSLQ